MYPALPVSLDCPFLIAPSVSLTFIFVLCLVYPALPVSLDCPFLIAPSVFSNVYFPVFLCLDCTRCSSISGLSIIDSLRFSLTFIFVLCLVYPVLPVSLDCPFLIAPSVFSNVYFRPVCVPGVTSVSGCVHGVTSVSGLSILDCPFGFSNVYFRPVSCVPGVASVSGLSILDCPFGFL